MQENAKPQIDANYEAFIRLTFNEINLVLAALGRAPHDQVEGTVNKIRIQAQAALHAAQHQAAAADTTDATPEATQPAGE
jgi:hypothetical protein